MTCEDTHQDQLNLRVNQNTLIVNFRDIFSFCNLVHTIFTFCFKNMRTLLDESWSFSLPLIIQADWAISKQKFTSKVCRLWSVGFVIFIWFVSVFQSCWWLPWLWLTTGNNAVFCLLLTADSKHKLMVLVVILIFFFRLLQWVYFYVILL